MWARLITVSVPNNCQVVKSDKDDGRLRDNLGIDFLETKPKHCSPQFLSASYQLAFTSMHVYGVGCKFF